MEPLRLSRSDARRVAVRAQLLTRERPADLLDVVRHLTLLQLDPTKAVAPSADLVLWSRLGSSYDAAELRDAVDEQVLIDHHGLIRPSEDLALLPGRDGRWPGRRAVRRTGSTGWSRWVEANDALPARHPRRARGDGPLPRQ